MTGGTIRPELFKSPFFGIVQQGLKIAFVSFIDRPEMMTN